MRRWNRRWWWDGTAVFGTRGGVTGILADALDRASVGAALRARHTFATTGERIAGLASCAGYIFR